MPKSRVKKKRLFREVSFQHERYVNKNYLKNLRNVKRNFCKEKGVLGGELDFLLVPFRVLDLGLRQRVLD
mgnify:CR=1 FL=1